MLLYLVPIEFFIAGAIAAIILLTTKKSGLSTLLLLGLISLALFIEIIFNIEKRDIMLALLPIIFMALQYVKKLQSHRQSDIYKNELFSDLKRVKKT